MEVLLAFFSMSFWVLMIIDCVYNERDRIWLWILIFLNATGAVIYFLARVIPRLKIKTPQFFHRWLAKDKLLKAEIATRRIGNAYQFQVYGDLLSQLGSLEQAVEAYNQAIDRDPQNLYAHWGVALIAFNNMDFSRARVHLEAILQCDREFKFGDASLLYGKTLYSLKEWGLAKNQFHEDYKYWSHPEAALLLSHLQIQDRETIDARATLENMISNLNNSPKFYYRQHVSKIRRAKKLLNTLVA